MNSVIDRLREALQRGYVSRALCVEVLAELERLAQNEDMRYALTEALAIETPDLVMVDEVLAMDNEREQAITPAAAQQDKETR